MKPTIESMYSSRAVWLLILLALGVPGCAQRPVGWELEQWPADLETDYALSALPAHLRAGATVYLLDPRKGYYVARQGTNGFSCFIARTEWEWAEFRKDLATPISYDAEGTRTIMPVYIDVSKMRASGQYTAARIKDSVMARIRKGIYQAPARPGISYMLAPVMRVYPGMPNDKTIVSMSMPHYMFYAPYLTNQDFGGAEPPQQGPVLLNAGSFVMGERKGPHGYVIVPTGKMEQAEIVASSKALLQRLVDYKPYFKIDTGSVHAH